MAAGWDKAYLRQAESDFDVFRQLESLAVDKSHKLHYLQMSSELLAKAYRSARTHGRRQPNVHESLVRAIRLAGRHGAVRRALGYSDEKAYEAFIRSIMPAAEAIERIYPKGDIERPNPEYPWESGGQIECPCGYPFSDLDLKRNVLRLAKFLDDFLSVSKAWLYSG
jgi:hypothetical protein